MTGLYRRIAAYRVLLSILIASVCCIIYASPCCAIAGEPHYASLDGNRVYYEDYGLGDEVVVFVHGWACDLTFWRLQAPVIAEKNRVIAIDLPGHGKSDKPHIDYTQRLFARAVDAVLINAKIKKAVLVGHSMGVSVIRQYALLHPAKVKGLINVDGALFDIPEEGPGLEDWKKQFRSFSEGFKADSSGEYRIGFVKSMFVPETPPEVRKEVLSKMSATPNYVASNAMEQMGDLTIWTETPVDAPMLAIYAENPALPADNEQFVRRLFPNLEYKMWGKVSHFYMFEKPDELNREINRFLERLNAN